MKAMRMRRDPNTKDICHALPIAFASLILPVGCTTDDHRPAPAPAAIVAPAPDMGSGAPALRLDAGDQLRVTVFGEDRISGPVTVESDGHITLPLAGQINVAGLTPQETGQRIAARLTGQLVHPRVTVTVTAWRPVYITGEVERAGQYAWQPGLNLMTAVALAGGATRRASHDSILMQSRGRGPLIAMKLSPQTSVAPGDLLKIPERFF